MNLMAMIVVIATLSIQILEVNISTRPRGTSDLTSNDMSYLSNEFYGVQRLHSQTHAWPNSGESNRRNRPSHRTWAAAAVMTEFCSTQLVQRSGDIGGLIYLFETSEKLEL
jgi:hypothetical protein